MKIVISRAPTISQLLYFSNTTVGMKMIGLCRTSIIQKRFDCFTISKHNNSYIMIF